MEQLLLDEARGAGEATGEASAIDLAAALDGVGGWLHLDEAALLYDSILRQPSRPGGLHVVEIGSWKGRSTIALGLAARRRGDTEVIAIDPHLGDNGEFYEDAETLTEFLANIERAGVSDVVRPIRAFSHEARPLVADASVSVLFLDGSHRYEDVSTDLRDWLPALCDGAILACNDSSKPGVYRALSETVLRRRAPFAAATLVRSTLFVEHCPDRTWTRADDIAWLKLRSVLFSRRVVHRFVRFLPGWAKRAGNAISQHAVHAGRDMPRS
jgi:MMP 1-O-methyltransferase